MGATRFPYTTLFRSAVERVVPASAEVPVQGKLIRRPAGQSAPSMVMRSWSADWNAHALLSEAIMPCACAERSEEHTSELQSLRHLVCRLLLEKKKK